MAAFFRSISDDPRLGRLIYVESLGRGPRRVLARVFGELAAKFQPLVDALNEVSESTGRQSNRDVLRLYELWLKTGSRRAHGLLQEAGITPSRAGGALLEH